MASRKRWVGGNWKCNLVPLTVEDLATKLNSADFDPKLIDVVICPPTIFIQHTKKQLKEGFEICAQNISKTNFGAYTGETCVAMLKGINVKWTLIGHSERRQLYSESDCDVAAKVAITQTEGIYAVVCIGELLEEREKGETINVLTRQIDSFVPKVSDWSKIVIAYEPVWAIGTGKVATPEEAQEAHRAIRERIAKTAGKAHADAVRIVYGGSVTSENCVSLLGGDIDGFLVGGASLKSTFVDIIQHAVTA